MKEKQEKPLNLYPTDFDLNRLARLLDEPEFQEEINRVVNILPKEVIDSLVYCLPAFKKRAVLNKKATTLLKTFSFFGPGIYNIILPRIFGRLGLTSYRSLICSLPHVGNNIQGINNYLTSHSGTLGGRAILTLTSGHKYSRHYLKNFVGAQLFLSANNIDESTGDKYKFRRLLESTLKNASDFHNNLWLGGVIDKPENILVIRKMADKYSKVNIILASLGGHFLDSSDYELFLKDIKKISNIYLDTALITDHRAILRSLEVIGSKRLIFASGAPFSLLNGEFVNDKNNNIQLAVNYHLPWAERGLNRQEKNPSLIHFAIIRAIDKALKIFTNRRKDYENLQRDIYSQNIKQLISC